MVDLDSEIVIFSKSEVTNAIHGSNGFARLSYDSELLPTKEGYARVQCFIIKQRQSRKLRVGFRCCRGGLAGFKMGLGVNKLLGSLDLEVSVFAGDDLCDVDRLVQHFGPGWTLRLKCVL